VSIPIVKTEKQDDGSILVFGKATGPDLDLDQQIIDPDFAAKGMAAWFGEWGNIRQMHSTALPPAGKAVELEDRGDEGQWIKAKIVEPGAVRLVSEDIYKAFSVGIANAKIVRDATAKNGRIIDGTFVETSLVDYPANPTCKFVMTKRVNAGGDIAEDGEIVIVDREILKAAEAEGGSPAGDASAQGAEAEKVAGEPTPATDASAVDAPAPETRAIPYVLRRLHDAHCPAYAWDQVTAQYPPLVEKDGVALTVGPQAMAAVHEMLLAEVQEDGGTGRCIWDIYDIWCVYRDLSYYLESERYEEVYGDAYMAARASLHESLKTALGGALPASAAPGTLKRPQLSAGQDVEARLMATHDRVAKLFPEICALEQAQVERMDPLMFVRPPAPDPLPTRPESKPADTELMRTATAPGEKAGAPDTTKVADPAANPDLGELIAARVAEAVEKAVKPLTEKIDEQQKLIDQLGAQPDEDKAPLRAPAGALRVEKTSHVDRAQERAAEDARRQEEADRAERVRVYKRMAESTEPDTREHARKQLAALGIEA